MGDDEEHTEEARLAIDREPGTFWTTERYQGGVITKAGAGDAAPGVGLYVDAEPGVAATRLQVESETAGWQAELYAAPDGDVPDSIEDWKRIGGGRVRAEDQRFRLDTGGEPYRYYLVWITALPEGEDRVRIDEVSLVAPIAR
jgi:serine/threonine-protein kinase